MFSIKSFVLCLALLVALVSAVPGSMDLHHRSFNALGAREAHKERALKVRSTRQRCKPKSTPKPKHAEVTHTPPPPPKKPAPKADPKPDPPKKQSSGGGGGGSHKGGVYVDPFFLILLFFQIVFFFPCSF